VWGGATKSHFFDLSGFEGQVNDSLPAREVRAGFITHEGRLRPISIDRQVGQSMIEFALTLVIIIILLVGLIDLGRAIFTYLALRDAAQEGASFASYNPTDTTGIIARVCNSSNMVSDLCISPGIDTQVALIGNACNGNGIQVVVTLDNFTLVTPFLGAIVGTQTIPISASVTDTILTPPCT
jgi:Flp pilus assembly protein TadG